MAEPSLFIDPTGNVTDQAAEDLPYAARLGYVKASPQQVEEHEAEKKYGTVGQQLKTAAEGAASAATFGLSTHAEKILGVKAEDIAAREKHNPIAHGLGTALGIAAPLALTGGAGALGEAAEFAAP